ncbi:hypothetical protein PPERSA_08597 [Pseudocohnilembus persalinus]|uniref:Complex 1 LYR protein domain-containing protein n=1 Tax=Pseudocohnilembus persalinus TaxID=266149 RepID=A0A0V0R1K9_PSEPJ|nr:hypothetical protein PPERSA_08597 [Pseudocohnilembus persalinus]|eukprot:KRX08398.1 hypothetical protein PPERSA_08597 [Pseudocohnilembus persalinus]
MSHKRHILDTILQKPIEHLKITRKLPPNKEALRLYREVLKFSNEFTWNNKNGENWGEIIRKSARKEFEVSKDEQDHLISMKMILTTRESIHKTREKMNTAFHKLNQNINETRND